MMGNYELLLNGVPVADDDCTVTMGSDWLAAISPEFDDIVAPSIHGSVDPRGPLRQASRGLTLKIACTGPDAFHSEVSRLARLTQMPDLTLTRRYSDSSMSAKVRCTSFAGDGDSVYELLQRLTVTFRLMGVWWRSDEYMERDVAISGGTVLPPPQSFAASGPDPGYRTMWERTPDDSTSMLFDRIDDGTLSDAPIPDAVIRVSTSVTTITISDPASGTGVTWNGTRSHPWLYLDPANLTAWESDTDSAWSGGSDVSSGIDYPTLGPLTLTPAVDGSYPVSARSSGGSSNAIIRFRFRRSWW